MTVQVCTTYACLLCVHCSVHGCTAMTERLVFLVTPHPTNRHDEFMSCPGSPLGRGQLTEDRLRQVPGSTPTTHQKAKKKPVSALLKRSISIETLYNYSKPQFFCTSGNKFRYVHLKPSDLLQNYGLLQNCCTFTTKLRFILLVIPQFCCRSTVRGMFVEVQTIYNPQDYVPHFIHTSNGKPRSVKLWQSQGMQY